MNDIYDRVWMMKYTTEKVQKGRELLSKWNALLNDNIRICKWDISNKQPHWYKVILHNEHKYRT